MPAQVDPPLPHAGDGVSVRGPAGELPAHAGALDAETCAQLLLEHGLHHRAAADVGDADAKDLFHLGGARLDGGEGVADARSACEAGDYTTGHNVSHCLMQDAMAGRDRAALALGFL